MPDDERLNPYASPREESAEAAPVGLSADLTYALRGTTLLVAGGVALLVTFVLSVSMAFLQIPEAFLTIVPIVAASIPLCVLAGLACYALTPGELGLRVWAVAALGSLLAALAAVSIALVLPWTWFDWRIALIVAAHVLLCAGALALATILRQLALHAGRTTLAMCGAGLALPWFAALGGAIAETYAFMMLRWARDESDATAYIHVSGVAICFMVMGWAVGLLGTFVIAHALREALLQWETERSNESLKEAAGEDPIGP